MSGKAVFFLLLVLALVIVIPLTLKPEKLVVPGTKIGSVDFSLMTSDKARAVIIGLERKPIYFNISNQSISPTYKDIGVNFNKDLINDFLTNCYFEKICFPLKTSANINNIVTIESPKINTFLDMLNGQIHANISSPVISFDDLTFYAQAPDTKVIVDKTKLLEELKAEKLFGQDPLSIKLTIKEGGDATKQNTKTEELLNKVISSSLLIKYGRQPVYIQPAELKNLVKIETDRGIKKVKILDSEVRKLIDTIKQRFNLNIKLDEFYSAKAIQYALLFRVGDEKLNTAVILPLVGDPKTDGKVANRYLEINKSQQRMYRFENGSVKKIYVVGTGLIAETPSGTFQILRKNRMSYSYYGNWYLPYMMPLGQFSNGNYFGLHEIPYHMDSAGNIYSRDENTMGSPATGGCIQMYREDVKEVYDWAEVGMPVIITD